MPRSKRRPVGLRPAIIICLVIVGVIVLSMAAGTSKTQAGSADAWEADLQRLTNVDRTSNGLSALLPHPGLYGIARGRSTDMIARQYFSHSIPGGGGAGDLINAQGIPYRRWGENIGLANVDDDSVVSYLESLWLNSPMHRANIMNPDYTHFGAGAAEGTYEGRDDTKIFTALFLQALTAGGSPPAPTGVAPPPPPPPPPPPSPTRKPPPPTRTLPPTPKPPPPTRTPPPTARPRPPTLTPVRPASPKARTPAPPVAPQQTRQSDAPDGTPNAVPPTATFPPPTFTPTQVPPTATPVPPTMTATSAPDTATPTPLPPTATRTSTPSPTRAVVTLPSTSRTAQPPPKGSGRLFDEIVDRLLRGLLNF